jgi:hypothetical protein
MALIPMIAKSSMEGRWDVDVIEASLEAGEGSMSAVARAVLGLEDPSSSLDASLLLRFLLFLVVDCFDSELYRVL